MRQLKIIKQITTREEASLEKYLNEIGKIDLISADEEVSLAQRIKTGDKEALDILVKANLRFVVSVAKSYQNQGLNLPDLINEGNIGLIKAAKSFDEKRGFKFITHAIWQIRGSIQLALARKSKFIRLPINQERVLSKIKKTISRFEQENERLPLSEEVVEILGITLFEMNELLSASNSISSLDKSFTEDGDGNLLDVTPDNNSLPADKHLMIESLASDLESLLSLLSFREKDILKKYYGIGCEEMTLEQIGSIHSLTGERIRKIREDSILKLKRIVKRGNVFKH